MYTIFASCFRFLGILITEKLNWQGNTIAMVKRANQWLYLLRTLNKCNLSAVLLKNFKNFKLLH